MIDVYTYTAGAEAEWRQLRGQIDILREKQDAVLGLAVTKLTQELRFTEPDQRQHQYLRVYRSGTLYATVSAVKYAILHNEPVYLVRLRRVRKSTLNPINHLIMTVPLSEFKTQWTEYFPEEER